MNIKHIALLSSFIAFTIIPSCYGALGAAYIFGEPIAYLTKEVIKSLETSNCKQDNGKISREALTKELLQMVWLDNLDAVEDLIHSKADVNGEFNAQDESALIIAASSNNLEMLKLLIENRANPFIHNDGGKNTLDWIEEHGSNIDHNIIKFLKDAAKEFETR